MLTLSSTAAAAAAEVPVRAAADIDSFFSTQTGQPFIDWFDAQLAGKDAWANRALGQSPDVRARFTTIWNNIPALTGQPQIDLIQFLALQAILINEVGRDLLPVCEGCGRQGFPGLAYPFSVIPGVKISYNRTPLNRLAGDLFFTDDAFWQAHQDKPLASAVRSRSDLQSAWNGTVYPAAFPTSLDPTATGFIQQADFFKFRGRGFIQATWRANYKRLIQWVQQYKGDQPVIVRFASQWQGRDPEVIATQSTNQDWDSLFQQTDLVAACAAVSLHNASSGNYLALSSDSNVLAAGSDQPGALFRMGLRISGGSAYATLFHDRVVQMLEKLFDAQT